MPKITVCVPVYNSANYLEQCLDSIINQTLTDLEIICVDDKSKDNSVEILEKYQKLDNRVKVIKQEENQGVGSARNIVINIASGEFISFIDSDDFIEKDMYRLLYNRAKEKNAEIAICDVNLYFDGGRKDKRLWFTEIEGVATPETLYKNTQPTNKITSLELLKRNDFSFFEGNTDGVYIDLMVDAKNITTVSEKLYNYRIRSNSVSGEFSVSHIEKTVDSCMELLKRSKKYYEYYEFKLIESLLQLLYVSVIEDNKEKYMETKNELNLLNYKKNRYLKSLLKKEYTPKMYFGIVNILPKNYLLSKFLIKKILKKSSI